MRVTNPLFMGLLLAALSISVLAQSNSRDAAEKTPSNLPKVSTEVEATKSQASATPTGSDSSSDPSDLPKLTKDIGPAYPSATIPPTANAPFMQKSSLPEGTVFIVVGSALGFFALAVIAWRALVAWSLHRSVKRAAYQSNLADTKAMLRPPRGGDGGFYAAGPGSTLSLDHLASSGRGGTAGNSARQGTPNHSNLFFSPTAGAGSTAGDRRSAYLPAGYYNAGSRDSQIMTHSDSSQNNFQLPTTPRYGGSVSGGRNGGSPPDSPPMLPSSKGNPNVYPSAGPQGQGLGGLRVSESHTSLSLPPTGRTPSTYLEDLFETHGEGPLPPVHQRGGGGGY